MTSGAVGCVPRDSQFDRVFGGTLPNFLSVTPHFNESASSREFWLQLVFLRRPPAPREAFTGFAGLRAPWVARALTRRILCQTILTK